MEVQRQTSLAHPFPIFSELKKAKTEEERDMIAQGLEALEESLPEGFRIGAAVVGGDSFFHSVAQGLNELMDQRSGRLTVASLRRGVEQYARESGRGSWLEEAVRGLGLTLPEYVSRVQLTSGDSEGREDVIWGGPRVEGKIICKQHGVKLRVLELRDDVDGLHVVRDKIGKGDRVVRQVIYRNHCVPLLRKINEHVKRRIKISREQVYGPEGSPDIPCDQSEIVDDEETSRGGKRRRSTTIGNSNLSKNARQDVDVSNTSDLLRGRRKDLFDIQIKLAKAIGHSERTVAFKLILDFLDTDEGIKCLDNVRSNGTYLLNMSSILHGAGLEGVKAFKELYNLWFDEQGKKSQYLQSIEKAGIKLSTISSILNGAGSKGPQAFLELYYVWFDKGGNLTSYLKTLEKEKISFCSVSSVLKGSGINGAKSFRDLFNLWFDQGGNKTRYLRTLERVGISVCNMTSLLNEAGSKAAASFKEMHHLLFDDEGNKTRYLKSLEEQEINFSRLSNILNKAGSKAPEAFKELHDLWFNADRSKTRYLVTLEKEEIKLSNVFNILKGSRYNAPKAFKELHNLWFKVDGSKTQFLITLEKEKINLRIVSSILRESGTKAPKAFLELYNLWFDEDGNKTKCLRSLEKEGMDLVTICGLLNGTGSKAPRAFKDLHERYFHKDEKAKESLKNGAKLVTKVDNVSRCEVLEGLIKSPAFRLDKKGSKVQYLRSLEAEGVKLATISSIVDRTGAETRETSTELYQLWFDLEGNKTAYLKSLEGVGVSLGSMCSILSGTGSAAPAIFRELYHLWFNDEQGTKSQFVKCLEREGISLSTMARVLSGRGSTATKDFKDLFHLLFDSDGNRSQLLDEFYEVGYDPRDLSKVLSMVGNAFSYNTETLNMCK